MTDDKRARPRTPEAFWWCEECMSEAEPTGEVTFGRSRDVAYGPSLCAQCGHRLHRIHIERESQNGDKNPIYDYCRRIRELQVKNRELEAQLEAQQGETRQDCLTTGQMSHAETYKHFCDQGMPDVYAADMARFASDLAFACDKMAQLEAQLDKWPKTKDGVRVFPGMMLYAPWLSVHAIDDSDWPFYPTPFELNTKIFFSYGPIWQRGRRECPLEDCYSSEEAAEAARAPDNPSEPGSRRVRTLVIARSDDNGLMACLSLPDWHAGETVAIVTGNLPEWMLPLMKPGARFYARVNLDAVTADYLVFDAWEEDGAAEARRKEIADGRRT